MAINKLEVNLTVTNLVNDLNSGLTWLKKDDLGYGSIESKYGPNPDQIEKIRKHPLLKDVDTTITIFNIIDDTKNETTSNTKESSTRRTDTPLEQSSLGLVAEQTEVVSSEAADIFANL
jgi:hypothetical protein